MQLELPVSDNPPPSFSIPNWQRALAPFGGAVGCRSTPASAGTEGGGISGCFAEEVPWCTSHRRGTSCCALGSCSLHHSPLPRCALIPSSLWEAGSSQRCTKWNQIQGRIPGDSFQPGPCAAGQEVGSKVPSLRSSSCARKISMGRESSASVAARKRALLPSCV